MCFPVCGPCNPAKGTVELHDMVMVQARRLRSCNRCARRQHSTQLVVEPAAACCRSTCATNSTGSANSRPQCGQRSSPAPPPVRPAGGCCMLMAPLLHPLACAVSACSISCCTVAKRAPHCGHASAPPPPVAAAAGGLEVWPATCLPPGATAGVPVGAAPPRCRCLYCCSCACRLSVVRVATATAPRPAACKRPPVLPLVGCAAGCRGCAAAAAAAGRAAADLAGAELPPPLLSIRRRLCVRLSRPVAAAAALAALPEHWWSPGSLCFRHTVTPQSRQVYELVVVSFSRQLPAGQRALRCTRS